MQPRPCGNASFLGKLIPDPLRKDPLLPRRRRQARMQGQWIGTAVAGHIGEEEGVALVRLKVEPEFGKARLAAAVTLVEIDQEGRDALAEARQILAVGRICRIEKVVVRLETLSDRI